MYKVFINDSSLELVDKKHAEEKTEPYQDEIQLQGILDELKTEKQIQHRVLQCKDPASVWSRMQGYYRIIEAAGGVVRNSNDEILMIFRLGKWDLPKGKLEHNESPEEGAVREVMEECGLSKPEIRKELPTTYHTYERDGQAILKRTFWYSMISEDPSKLSPQAEEHIEHAQWVNTDIMDEYLGNTYASIRWLLKQVIV